jgi:hypothetical protein
MSSPPSSNSLRIEPAGCAVGVEADLSKQLGHPVRAVKCLDVMPDPAIAAAYIYEPMPEHSTIVASTYQDEDGIHFVIAIYPPGSTVGQIIADELIPQFPPTEDRSRNSC